MINIETAILDLKPTIINLLARNSAIDLVTFGRIDPKEKETISEILQTCFNINKNIHIERFNQHNNSHYDLDLSSTLKLGTNLIGFFLILQTDESNTSIYAVYTDPKYRKLWPTCYLKYMSFCHLKNSGIESVEFQAYKNNKDTLKHARRLNAEHIDNNQEQ